MDFDVSGKLPAGLHSYTIEEFIAQFVDGFPTSMRRKTIFDAMVEFLKELNASGIPYEFWVDGSYTTTKINPNDADIVVFLQIPQYNALGPQFGDLRNKYRANLDLYFAVAISDENRKMVDSRTFLNITNQRNYWRGQFGFDREDKPKGIVCLSSVSLKDYIDRR